MIEKSAKAIPPDDTEKSTPKGRSRASQGRGWLNTYNAAHRIIFSRPDDHLSTVVADLRELAISRKNPKYARSLHASGYHGSYETWQRLVVQSFPDVHRMGGHPFQENDILRRGIHARRSENR